MYMPFVVVANRAMKVIGEIYLPNGRRDSVNFTTVCY